MSLKNDEHQLAEMKKTKIAIKNMLSGKMGSNYDSLSEEEKKKMAKRAEEVVKLMQPQIDALEQSVKHQREVELEQAKNHKTSWQDKWWLYLGITVVAGILIWLITSNW